MTPGDVTHATVHQSLLSPVADVDVITARIVVEVRCGTSGRGQACARLLGVVVATTAGLAWRPVAPPHRVGPDAAYGVLAALLPTTPHEDRAFFCSVIATSCAHHGPGTSAWTRSWPRPATG